ncbi:DCC1-like thiol-disulfide oxidoreductase family protein [Sphingobacterium griseoflavum]|uniref:DUF393 domain-containing protein n=1 Tax=Sphingobacterium griseoflavum TaxID=1474952 RepID=A0ABQ3HVC4_9SPHI|nr:DCC1-like thiol-disulfide oxidoreductase family protein [Sphingobacterium griseoflavum]GHE28720.1 hypothetical protein GCM10017764_09080 [Sphingobacterium griseoflavum]
MKALQDHLILFDAECPMCRLYTQAFVDRGMLDKDGRKAYQEFPADACPLLDRQRAVNEIALVNLKTGDVTYGIESILKIVSTSYPLLRPILLFKPFLWFMRKLYAFISFNRRVIIPAPVSADTFQLQPSFRLRYRLAYLVLTWLITSAVLTAYVPLMGDLLPQGASYREYIICGGQLFFQSAIIGLAQKGKHWDYLGNMMTISLAGALLLLPILLLAPWLTLPPMVYVGCFLLVAAMMLLEHIRRTKLLGMGQLLTISWVLYRLLVLLFIFLYAAYDHV